MKHQSVLAMVLIVTTAIVACGRATQNPVGPTSSTPVTAVVVTSASPSGPSFQLTATARMTDGSSRDVTTAATWESSNPLLATVTATGLVSVVGSGEVDVRATYQAVTGAIHLLVGKLPVVAVSLSGAPAVASSPFQMTATARLVDGSTQDVTRSATWTSSNVAVATVTSTGYVMLVGNGDVNIEATYQGVVGSSHVNVVLGPRFVVSGVVAEAPPNGGPIAGARIQIVPGAHTFSDEHGVFNLAGVPAGRIILEVSKDGYETWSNEVVIDRDTQLPVINLARVPQPLTRR